MPPFLPGNPLPEPTNGSFPGRSPTGLTGARSSEPPGDGGMYHLAMVLALFGAACAWAMACVPSAAMPADAPHSRAAGARVAAASPPAAGEPNRAQNRPARSDQEILIQLERDWDAAFLRNDASFIERILAEEFVVTYPDGSRGDKAHELRLAAEFNQQIDSSTLDEFIVKVFGDTAIVWFTRRLEGPSQGRRLEVTYRYVDVFVWRVDRWQCVASQSTKVAP